MARVGRTAALLVPLAIASRGAAFVVPLVIAMWFGAGVVTDAWYWALAFPTFTMVLASTAVSTAAIPAMARVRAADPSRLPRFIGGLLSWTTLATALGGLAVALSGPWALRVLTDFPATTRQLAAADLWGLLPFTILVGAGAPLRAGCELHGRFAGVVVSPLLRAGVVIGVTWILLAPLGPKALPWGLVAGEALQVGWWTALLIRAGVRPRIGLHVEPELIEVGRALAPLLGGELLVAMNVVIDKAFAAWLPPGSVATLEYADRVRVIPQTLLESSLLMVSFATWSNLHAQGEEAASRRAVDQAMRWTVALAAPALAGLFIGREALVRLLYERGAFTVVDTRSVAAVLAWSLPGVLPNLLGILAVRAHIVESHLRLVLALGLASVLLNAALNTALIGPLGLEGLALSTSLTMTIVPAIYLWLLRPVVRPDGQRWLPVGGIALASIGVAALTEVLVGPPSSVLDPSLWWAALPCLGLLALGVRTSRR